MKKYIKRNSLVLVRAIIFTLLASVFAVLAQFLKGQVLDQALGRNINQVLLKGSILGAFILLEILFYYFYDISRGKFAVQSMKQLRKDYMVSLINRTYPAYSKLPQAEYLAKYTNEMSIIENQYFSTIPMLFEIIIKIIIVSVSLFVLDYRIALVTLFLLTMPLYVPKIAEKHLQRAEKNFVIAFEQHLTKINDWLKGFELIKNFAIEKAILNQFVLSNDHQMEKNYIKRRMGYITKTISTILSYFSHFVVLIFAAYLVLKGDFTAGGFFIAIGMIDQLSYPIISLSYFLQDIISCKPINQSLIEFISVQLKATNDRNIVLNDVNKIEFKNVSFSFGNNSIISNKNLIFRENGLYLLKGKSGSGKTTSMNLLMNYYNVTGGQILLNDTPIEKIKNINELVTVMRQDSVLFQDTLRNNLTMYSDMPDQVLRELLAKVGFAGKESNIDLDMMLDEAGGNLSGGEKRRIAFIRAILRNTPILILDEPLANLDDATADLIESLMFTIKDRIIIVISHQFTESRLNDISQIYEF